MSLMEKEGTRRSEESSLLDKILAVIGIVLILLLVGYIIGQLFKLTKSDDKEEVDPLEEAKQRLLFVEERIIVLSPIRGQISKTQKTYFLIARVIIGLLIIGVNLGYLCYYNWEFRLGEMVTLNGALVMIYSFFAFILFGNPKNFVKSIKFYLIKMLRNRHVAVLSELETLENEKQYLILKIEELEDANRLERDSNGELNKEDD